MTTYGTLKANGIAIAEFSADFKGGNVKLSATAAFLVTNSGRVSAAAGWTKGEGAIWSEKTIACLSALTDAMEEDLGRLHFVQGGEDSRVTDVAPTFLGGLGEHLAEPEQA